MKRTIPLILLVVGIVMMVVGVVLGVRGVADAVSSTTEWVSGENPRQVVLTQGEWALYEETVSPSPLAREVTAEDVTVTGPSGAVAVSAAGVETVTINNRTFSAVARFTVPSDGTYEIGVEPAGSSVVVGRSVGATVLRAFGFVGLVSLGGLLAFAGVVWLIVAFIVSRSRRHQQVQAGAAPYAAGTASPATGAPPYASAAMTPPPVSGPGQWYPDPEDPTQWRWWDGRAWTDQRAPRQ